MGKSIFEGITDVEHITALIQKLEESSFNFLKVEDQDFKIVIGKNGAIEINGAQNTYGEAFLNPNPGTTPAPQDHFGKVAVGLETQNKEQSLDSEHQEIKKASQENVVYVRAITAGLFYAQPEPGADPYVKVGDVVEPDTTIGLIEIMKVFSAISAGVSGKITEILVEDGQLVEYNQPLISVQVK